MRHKKVEQSSKYKLEGDKITKQAKDCPRCGTGTFLAVHKNRVTCGKCGFSEIQV